MIKLYQFQPEWGLPNASPFCLKLETYLIMTGLRYQNIYVKSPKGSPKMKLPYIEYKGQKIGDSALIIDYLKKDRGDPLDGALSDNQRLMGHSLCRRVEENLYWCIVYYRWIEEENWQKLRKKFAESLPPVVKGIVPGIIRKEIRKQLYMQGMGRHAAQEILSIAKKDIWTLSKALGDKQYFLGARPTSYDATFSAFLVNIVCVPIESPLKKYVQSFDNLTEYCLRFRKKYYPSKS